MAVDLERVAETAARTRHDFEAGLVTDDEVIAAAVALDAVRYISMFIWRREERTALLEAGKMREVGDRCIPVPLIGDISSFPKGFCNIASILLAKNLKNSEALGENVAKIVYGGCGEDTDTLNKGSYYHNVHTFLDIGHTELGWQTIVDITADQFGQERLPAIYVGPLIDPWTTDPRIEQHEY